MATLHDTYTNKHDIKDLGIKIFASLETRQDKVAAGAGWQSVNLGMEQLRHTLKLKDKRLARLERRTSAWGS